MSNDPIHGIDPDDNWLVAWLSTEEVPDPVRLEIVIDHYVPFWLLNGDQLPRFGEVEYEECESGCHITAYLPDEANDRRYFLNTAARGVPLPGGMMAIMVEADSPEDLPDAIREQMEKRPVLDEGFVQMRKRQMLGSLN